MITHAPLFPLKTTSVLNKTKFDADTYVEYNGSAEVFSETVSLIYFAFLYESMIWLGAKIIDVIISSTDRLIIPLNRNSTDGIIESASALKTLLFLKQMIHIRQ